jgi:hypothetical protein
MAFNGFLKIFRRQIHGPNICNSRASAKGSPICLTSWRHCLWLVTYDLWPMRCVYHRLLNKRVLMMWERVPLAVCVCLWWLTLIDIYAKLMPRKSCILQNKFNQILIKLTFFVSITTYNVFSLVQLKIFSMN